jgi:hypothetical protein
MKNRANRNQEAGSCPFKCNFIHLLHVSIRRRKQRQPSKLWRGRTTYPFFLDENSHKCPVHPNGIHPSSPHFHPSLDGPTTRATQAKDFRSSVHIGMFFF